MGRIRVGNSGWSYGDWIGPFYSGTISSANLLRYYFSRFDTVEVNSTFYRVPGRSTIMKWASEASNWEGREFTVKVPSSTSHVSAMEEGPENMMKDLDRFGKTVLDPLDDSGVLGAVLFQASPYFTVRSDIKYQMKSRPKVPLPEYKLGMNRLEELCGKLSSIPGDPAVEFRNSSWLDEDLRLRGEARDILRAHGVAVVIVDGPSFPWLSEDTSRHNYIRFHGRNREAWFKGTNDDPGARYVYDYNEEELLEKVAPIRSIASKVNRETRVYFNNHPRGMAPKNAAKLMELLGIPPPSGPFDRFR